MRYRFAQVVASLLVSVVLLGFKLSAFCKQLSLRQVVLATGGRIHRRDPVLALLRVVLDVGKPGIELLGLDPGL